MFKDEQNWIALGIRLFQVVKSFVDVIQVSRRYRCKCRSDIFGFRFFLQLKLTLLKKDHELITKCPTKNTAAYERYLKGRFFVTRRGAWIIQALECFQQAVALDSEFALAHAALADANLLIASYGLMPVKNILAQAKQYAEKQ